MKNMILAAVAVLSLGVGSAFAQGKPPGDDPGTAPQAFPNEPYHTGTVFSEIFGHRAEQTRGSAQRDPDQGRLTRFKTASRPGHPRPFCYARV